MNTSAISSDSYAASLAGLRDLMDAQERLQRESLCLVASSSPTLSGVREVLAGPMTAVTAEGYVGARWHAGTPVADELETHGCRVASRLFGAAAANLQPHSASSANLAVYAGLLRPGASILGLDLDAGGHLTHGSKASVSGRWFKASAYAVGPNGRIDLDAVRAGARADRPDLIVCGASAYPRMLDFEAFGQIADDVGARLLADVSHVSGLVAAGLHPNPAEVADVVTLSTYKQLFGPRGGVVLTNDADITTNVNRGVFPLTQGTPDFSAVAAKIAALEFATTGAFRRLMTDVVRIASELAEALLDRGLSLVTGGTDTHMVLIDLRPLGVTGDVIEQALEACGIQANRNRIPNDPSTIRAASGVRLGANWLAARRFDTHATTRLADVVADVIRHAAAGASANTALDSAARRVRALAAEYPLDALFGR